MSQIAFDDPFALLPTITRNGRTSKSAKVIMQEMLKHFDSPKIKPMIVPLGLKETVDELRERLKDA